MKKDVEKILEMIETVDPADIAKLDEIDARVWCYLHPDQLHYVRIQEGMVVGGFCGGKGESVWRSQHLKSIPYTRSRDALKAIRPEGCFISLFIHPGEVSYQCWNKATEYNPKPFPHESDSPFATEELAELHGIIQARSMDTEP